MNDLLAGKSGQVKVYARFAESADNMGNPHWENPRLVTLHIERRDKSLKPRKYQRLQLSEIAGNILCMTPLEFGFAEFREDDHDEQDPNFWSHDGGYYMEIIKIEE